MLVPPDKPATQDEMGRSGGIEWAANKCFECGCDVDSSRGTPTHPPLCEECADLWYPTDPIAGDRW